MVIFHIKAFIQFSTATFVQHATTFLPLLSLALGALVVLQSVSPPPLAASHQRFAWYVLASPATTRNAELAHWFSLHENSPSFS